MKKKTATRRPRRVPPAKGGARGFATGEYVRVVPLHQPKPALTIGELARARAGEARDPYDGRPQVAPAQAQLTYRGGPLLGNVEVFSIFWGKTWGAAPSSTELMSKLNKFFADILVSPAIDQLSEYNVPGQAIGHGSFTGTKVIGTHAPVGSVTDSTIQAQVRRWIKGKTVPKNTKNTLYFLYLEPGVVSIMGGSRSCQSFCGYHNNVGAIYYAVMPYPTCDGCRGGMSVFDVLTGTSSHELCEAITDPVPGMGWYDDQNGEIGDICAWSFKQVAGYTVQLEWSNQRNTCV